MNITERGVTNAANLALFMVNLSTVLLSERRQQDPDGSLLDLKAEYRARKYITETIKMLPDQPDADIVARIFEQVARLGRIHAYESHPYAA